MKKNILFYILSLIISIAHGQNDDADCTNESCISIYKNQFVLNYLIQERGEESFNAVGDIPVYYSFTSTCPTFLCKLAKGATKLENLINKIKVPSYLLFEIEFVANGNETYQSSISLEQSSVVVAQMRFNQDTLTHLVDSIGNKHLEGITASLSQIEQATADALVEMLNALDILIKEPTDNIDDIVDDKILDYVRVAFEENEEQVFGFDSLKYDAHNANYDKVIYNQSVYNIPWKSIPTGENDIITARVNITNEEYSIDSIFFRSEMGNVSRQKVDGKPKYNLSPIGLNEGDENYVEAFYRTTDTAGNRKEVQVGKVKLSTYNPETQNLFIVPVNDSDVNYSKDEIESALNTIFNQAIMNWDVEKLDRITISDWGDNHEFNDSTTALLANYTDDMKLVIETLEDNDNDAFYIFLVKNPKSGNKVGYMPKRRRFGFIFVDQLNLENDFYTTLAHELSHGAFRLEHTFEAYPQLSKGTTDNLMDYKQGTYLHKYQWDYIHDPAAIIPWFQDEEEGAMIANDINKIKEVINKIKQNNLNSIEFFEISFSEGLYLMGKDVELGETTYEYIKIDARMANYESWNKVITTNIFNVDPDIHTKIDGNIQRMTMFDFDRRDYINGVMENVPFEIYVLAKDANAFESYISPTTFEIENVNSGINDAIDDGEGFNATGAACNVCVRASLHHIASNNVLFPYAIASTIGDQGTESYTGKISGVGRANNIYVEMLKWINSTKYTQLTNYKNNLEYNDYKEWIGYCKDNTSCKETRENAEQDTLNNNIKRITEFEQISKDVIIKIEGKNYQVPNFNNLQKQANNGILIIGVRRNMETKDNGNYKSGHIVIISPYDEESNEDDSDRPEFTSTGNINIKFPRTVECGGNIKKLGWLSKDFAKDMEWYRYK